MALDTPAVTDVGIDTHGGNDVVATPDVPTAHDAGSRADAGCSSPSTLHPPSPDAGTRTLYCPFSSSDGGTNAYCQPGAEHCCEPTSGTASCVASATACAASDTDWQCEDPGADCPSGSVCCAAGMLVLSTDPFRERVPRHALRYELRIERDPHLHVGRRVSHGPDLSSVPGEGKSGRGLHVSAVS